MMLFFWLVPYILVSVVYIVAAWRKKPRPQGILKPFLMPLLLLFRLLTAGWDLLICPALLLGWAGDLLLMLPRGKGFVPGLVAFLVGHIFYIIYALRALVPVMNPASLLWCLPTAAFSLTLTRRLLPKLGPMKVPACAYCLILSLLAVSGGCWFFSDPSLPSCLFALGGICFALSDAQLAIGIFDRPAKRQDFIVMLTYILAQGLLVFSSCL